MKVLHIITRLVRGGAQRNTLMCAQDQVGRGYEVWVVSGVEAGPEGSLWEEARTQDYHLIPLKALQREISPWADVQALVWLYRFIRKHRFEIVHTHTSKAGLLGRAAAHLAGTPVIIHTPHGHVFHSYFSSAKERLIKGLEKLAAGWCDKLVALSTGCLEDHVRFGICPAEQMCIIPSGVELGPYQHCQQVDESVAQLPGPRLGMVARLVDIKGVLDLVEAMPRVVQAIPQCSLVLAGDGPLRPQVEERIAELGLGKNVTLLGEVVEVAPIYRALDVLVLPSHNEGMGRVLVEGMSAGLATVATRVGGVPDVVIPDFNGLLVPPRNPAALAEALISLLQDEPLRRQMAQNGVEHAKSFSDQVMYERLEQLYQEVWQSRLSRPPRLLRPRHP